MVRDTAKVTIKSTPLLGGNALEFLDETYPTKGMKLPYGKNFMIQSSIVFLW